jgi:hypothetical protein
MGSWWVGYGYASSDPPSTHDPPGGLTDIAAPGPGVWYKFKLCNIKLYSNLKHDINLILHCLNYHHYP